MPPSAGQLLGWGQGHLEGIKIIWEQGTPFKGLMEYKRIKVNKALKVKCIWIGVN